ncbi:D-erythronate dehydrogenase [Phytopseudomonas daroniae]|uniref:D-erythronate dehydrogenase n=1 Tax=Phytopseudomonas daroniae TaxID=2487519 RepID=UPI0010382DB2|nr:D-erythronate dehydrogenase [Pseudomonas daroniae]TBU71029.1 NAD-dependent epimerase [Pseudomonas daroniae]
MKILVTGGAGFLGARLIEALLAPGARDLLRADDSIVSADLAPCPVKDPRVTSHIGDICDPAFIASLVGPDTGVVYHLAAVVSGQAEADFDLGLRINFDATRALLEACRQQGQAPRFVFASSLAVFGGPIPEQVPESLAPLPQSSYGAQKAMAELLIADYSRKGFVDGRVCRLPTISVRPGKPNAAASSFASGILREPLAGMASNCPVPLDTRLWLSSPQTVIGNLLHAARLDGEVLGLRRTLNLPGISVRVSEMLDSLARVGGNAARERVSFEADERVQRIVCSWPGDFDIERPLQLGFAVDADFDSVVKAHQHDMNR